MKIFKIFTRALIINKEGKILLVQKNENQKISPLENLLPGGGVEFGEKPENAILREVFEETGLEVSNPTFIDTKTIISGNIHHFGIYFVCNTENYNIKNIEPENHLRVFWGGIEDINGTGKEVLEKFYNKK